MAQAKPDFSGTWTFNQTKRSPGTPGNLPDIPFPTEMVVKQTLTNLEVTMSGVGPQSRTLRFRLDGSTVTIGETPSVSETGEARFEGANMVMTTHRRFSSGPPRGGVVQELEETWSLSRNVLTVEKSRIGDVFVTTATGVFNKK